MLAKKNIGIIGAGVAAAIIIVFAVTYFGSGGLSPETTKSEAPENTATSTGSADMQGPSLVTQSVNGTYRINTECELVYGIANGVYPDGEKIPGVKVESLLNDYPEEFKQWKEILQSPENRTAFFNKPLPEEFRGVLTVALMKESSINPNLLEVAKIVTDPQGKAKLQQAFQEFSCQSYFDERQKK